ncbi:MAG: hypothetical protein V4463_05915 [Pseudomonadota bacterium]
MKYAAYKILSGLPNGALYGASFRRSRRLHADFLASGDQAGFVTRFREQALAQALARARATPFYARQGIGRTLADFPLIDKATVLDNFEALLHSRHAADLVTTGGTSGKPLAFYIDKNRKGAEWYWMTTGWACVGFELGRSWRAVLRNHALGERISVDNPLLREVCFDNFKLGQEYLRQVTAVIAARALPFVHAYPSAAYTLASFWHEHDCKPPSVRAFLCGSENVFPFQKALIQGTLGIRMLTWFGHSEKLILAHEGAQCENYHANPFYGITELLDEAGQAVAPGASGELVGTGFINTRMPFVRYRTGDHAHYVGEHCPDCGHIGTTFRAVQGRWSGDRIYRADGNVVTTTALNLHDAIYKRLNGLQYHQHRKGALEIWVVPGDNWDSAAEQELLAHLKMKVPVGLDFSVKPVKEVAYGANRKYQLLMQHVDKEQG